MRTFHGAWPALATPFTADDQVNPTVLKELTEYLIDKGVEGLYVCGSTGEGIYMSVAERKLVTETVLEQVNGRIPVIVHIGCMVTSDAVELAQHAQAVGVDGISSIIPPRYSAIEGISTYFAKVAGAVPDLPFLPYLFHSSINAATLMRSLEHIPNLAGTKYTGPNMYEFRQIVTQREAGWSVFSGMDEQCVFAAMFGSCGNIGSTLNVIPGIYRQIHQACQTGDLGQARDLQLRANRVTEVLIGSGFMGALKETLTRLGFPCGQPRLPTPPFPEGQRKALQAQLEAVEFSAVAEM